MALFDFLKRKIEVEKARSARASSEPQPNSSGQAKEKKEVKQTEKKADKVSVKKEPKEAKKGPVKSVSVKPAAKQKGFSYEIVKEPHISEKGTMLAEQNKYVFKIYSNANKPTTKKAIEGIYGVDVEAVKIIKIPPKKRRLGRTEGFKKGYVKAIVTVKKGQKIEIF